MIARGTSAALLVALGMALATVGVEGQEKHSAFELGTVIERGAVHAFEDAFDIRGFRLGDSEGQVDKLINELIAEIGPIVRVRRVDQAAWVYDARAAYEYTERLELQFSEGGVSDSISISFGTPASGASVDEITRSIVYLGNILPPLEATVRSIRTKYGTPSLTFESGQGVYFTYRWIDGALVKPGDVGADGDNCTGNAGYSPFRYRASMTTTGGCTATLSVSVTSDGEGRVSMLIQTLTSFERRQRDFELSTAFIDAAIEKDHAASGVAPPKL